MDTILEWAPEKKRPGNRSDDPLLTEVMREMILHDLRTPLATVISALAILSGEQNLTEDQRRSMLAGAMRGSLRMEGLVNLLLGVGAAYIPVRRQVAVAELVEQAWESLRPCVREKGVKLIATVSPDEVWRTDPHIADSVVCNLLNNAVKYSPVSGSVRVSARREGRRIALHIDDEGDGIAADVMDGIADPSHRADPTRGTVGERGAGVGLILCERAASRMGGRLRADRRVGGGSRFTIAFEAER